jgi:hypothetical protein
MKKLVDVALGSANRHSKAKSPAKKFYPVGKNWVDGIIVGMEQTTPKVVKMAEIVVDSAHKAMTDAGTQAINVFDGVSDPVIRPVVDLDNVYQSAKDIASAMSDVSSIRVSGEIGARVGSTTAVAATTGSTTSTKELTYIQNNYSPKPLSRLEIYRQTNNQLRSVKGIGG